MCLCPRRSGDSFVRYANGTLIDRCWAEMTRCLGLPQNIQGGRGDVSFMGEQADCRVLPLNLQQVRNQSLTQHPLLSTQTCLKEPHSGAREGACGNWQRGGMVATAWMGTRCSSVSTRAG